ncbi:MAG: hypothetical protein ABEL51_03655 [Salinibacter sp.]
MKIETKEQFARMVQEKMDGGQSQEQAIEQTMNENELSESLKSEFLFEGIYRDIRTSQVIEQSFEEE